MGTNFGNRAACYRIEKRGTPEISWGGCWEECCENSGCCRECWRGCCEGVFLGKEWGAAPSPALPAAPRIFAALFPAPSPANFWGSPFLYSVAGRPVPSLPRIGWVCRATWSAFLIESSRGAGFSGWDWKRGKRPPPPRQESASGLY